MPLTSILNAARGNLINCKSFISLFCPIPCIPAVPNLPTFLAPGTGFAEGNFSTDGGGGGVFRR